MKPFVLSTLLVLTQVAVSFGQSTQQDLAFDLFDAARYMGQTGTEAVELAAEAVWGASELNGSATFTGTVTQSAVNPDLWTYSPSPNDRLVVAYHGGPNVEFSFTVFTGYTDGTWEDFVEQHQLDFTVFVDGVVQARVESQSQYVAEKTFEAQRHLVGSISYEGSMADMDLRHSATVFQEIDSGWLHVRVRDEYSGNASTPTTSFVFDQGWRTRLIHTQLGALPEHVRETELWNNSSATEGGVVYRYEDAYAFMVVGSYVNGALFNVVIEPEKWERRGSFTADGQVLGTIEFGSPVLAMAYMPNVVVRFVTGGDVTLPGIFGATATDTERAAELPTEYRLLHNYPNPFNSSTTIVFEISQPGPIRLSVHNAFGNQVAKLVDGVRLPGRYELRFAPQHLPSGVYVVRLAAGDVLTSRKIVLVR